MKAIIYNHKLEPLVIVDVAEYLMERDRVAFALDGPEPRKIIGIETRLCHCRPVPGGLLKSIRLLVLAPTEPDYTAEKIVGAVPVREARHEKRS